MQLRPITSQYFLFEQNFFDIQDVQVKKMTFLHNSIKALRINKYFRLDKQIKKQ